MKGSLVATRNRTWKEQRTAKIAAEVYTRQQQTYVICLIVIVIVALMTGGLSE